MQLSGWSKAWLLYKHHTTMAPHNTPCGQMAKNQTDGQLEWLSRNTHTTIQLQRCSYCFICIQRAMQLSGWSKAWLLRKHHTIMALHNTPCGQMAKNRTDGQLEWLSHGNHNTIQLQRCHYCFIFFQRAMQSSGWSEAWLLYKHHTIMALHNTPCGHVAKRPKIELMGNLNGCCTVTFLNLGDDVNITQL